MSNTWLPLKGFGKCFHLPALVKDTTASFNEKDVVILLLLFYCSARSSENGTLQKDERLWRKNFKPARCSKTRNLPTLPRKLGSPVMSFSLALCVFFLARCGYRWCVLFRVPVPFQSDRANLTANPKWKNNAENNNLRIVWADCVLKINRKDGKVSCIFLICLLVCFCKFAMYFCFHRL